MLDNNSMIHISLTNGMLLLSFHLPACPCAPYPEPFLLSLVGRRTPMPERISRTRAYTRCTPGARGYTVVRISFKMPVF